MIWSDNRKRIRRFLRDPNAKIWDDATLLDLWNKAQDEINDKTGFLVKVEQVKVPPDYETSYLHDWEFAFLPAGHGFAYQALHYYEQGEIVICYPWEGQNLGGIDASSTDIGAHFTIPWEGFIEPCADPIPLRFPYGFDEAILSSWNRWPIEHLDRKQMQYDDPSWKEQAGRPVQYWRFDFLENVFFLYPRPSTVNWDETLDEGMITSTDEVTEDSEYGTIAVMAPYLFNQDEGILTEVIGYENNCLFIFLASPTKIGNDTESSDFPSFLLKYIEYCVLKHAFNLDTDGKNEALRDFWGMREIIGIEIIKRYKSKMRADRDYRLVTRGAPGLRNRRGPRLPDTYPPSY